MQFIADGFISFFFIKLLIGFIEPSTKLLKDQIKSNDILTLIVVIKLNSTQHFLLWPLAK